jgi:16S rRNA A1518/A1519 N6-dimethyltransferase RsmA/KsgA/DIM1 with predicted DNA glycosylase/AP lyase activity
MAEPGSRGYGRLSVSAQLLFEMETLALVDRRSFNPAPKVDSCIISLKRTGTKISQEEEAVLGAIFSHKKKSLRNAIVDARESIFRSRDKAAASRVALSIKYSERKVFTLSPAEALEAARGIAAAGSREEPVDSHGIA